MPDVLLVLVALLAPAVLAAASAAGDRCAVCAVDVANVDPPQRELVR